jgi:alpha-D-ribose 1-methylphosphonate 5-triphosphate diphosphatase
MTVLTNAKIVLPDAVITGSLSIDNGIIGRIGDDASGEDLDGDFLIPGIIDLHTDNLERQVLPRSNARWPSRSAFLSHDAQCAAAGITTVFDALCLGDIGFEKHRLKTYEEGVRDLAALAQAGVLKAQHLLHLRCELPAPEMPDMLAGAINNPYLRLVSLMDHSPGGGQYANVETYRQMRVKEGFSDPEITEMISFLQDTQETYHAPNRRFVLETMKRTGIPIASHDDLNAAEIARNHAEGITIAEFPVTMEAAVAARAHGGKTIAGAPNIVRGGSHSGNVAVLDLIRAGVLDALASDYVPAAMLEAAFICAHENVLHLPAAIALISSGPADLVGLHDRGRIVEGLAADLVRVRLHDGLPVIRAVWRRGLRIA